MKLIVGNKYRVAEGSGCDSGRVGKLCSASFFNKKFIQENELGRYWEFDPKKECILWDEEKEEYFTMFKNRLVSDIGNKE